MTVSIWFLLIPVVILLLMLIYAIRIGRNNPGGSTEIEGKTPEELTQEEEANKAFHGVIAEAFDFLLHHKNRYLPPWAQKFEPGTKFTVYSRDPNQMEPANVVTIKFPKDDWFMWRMMPWAIGAIIFLWIIFYVWGPWESRRKEFNTLAIGEIMLCAPVGESAQVSYSWVQVWEDTKSRCIVIDQLHQTYTLTGDVYEIKDNLSGTVLFFTRGTYTVEVRPRPNYSNP